MKPTKLSTIDDWLAFIGVVHATPVALGLKRVREVARRLGILPSCPVITVGGTNGKGSTVAGLEAIYRAAGYQTGAFTSPVMLKHCEQVRINGLEASESDFCDAFESVERLRGDIRLTPFEFHALAAFWILQSRTLDVWLLEVGVGGRLDAVNSLDADVAIVTSISIDHVAWLGETRESIGFEKAGIFRSGKPAICGDSAPPASLRNYAQEIGATFLVQGQDFGYSEEQDDWTWFGGEKMVAGLPKPSLYLSNMATVLMTVQVLESRLPVTIENLKTGLAKVALKGRLEIKKGQVTEIYDVAHNLGSVQLLAEQLERLDKPGKTVAVFSMLADKDMLSCVRTMANHIDHWFIAELDGKRATPMDVMMSIFTELNLANVSAFASIQSARDAAREQTCEGDILVVFGSFHTVAVLSE